MYMMKAVFDDGTELTRNFRSDHAFAWRVRYLDTNTVAQGICASAEAAQRRIDELTVGAARSGRSVKSCPVVKMTEVKR
jgi:hypothetical protein